MPRGFDAEEHLRVIRSLMERATVYRAISAQGALLGGVLALLVGGLLWWRAPLGIAATEQTAAWVVVLAITSAVNSCILYADARRRRAPFISSGMKMALRAVAPSFIAAGAATVCWPDRPEILGVIWTLCFGLALLSTSHFAPKSITYLGWAFLTASIVCIFMFWRRLDRWHSLSENAALFNGYMASTFGFFHLIYAACTWSRRPHSSAHHNGESMDESLVRSE